MKKVLTILLIGLAITGFSQKATNNWNGSDNTNWHDADNWSLGHIPTSTEDVVIPTGISRYPSVYLTDEEIKSLSVESDAFIRIGPRELVITGDVYVFGEIIMYNTDAELHCQNIFWYSGSTAQTTGDCSYFIGGNWKYVSGANVQLDEGYVFFVGNGSNYLISQDEDCYFNTIWVDKTGGVFGHSASSVTSCTIKENLFLYGSNYDFLSYDAETIIIGSALINGSSSISMTLNKGTIEFAGNPTFCMIRPQPGDYINNLTVNTGSYDLDMNNNDASLFEIKGDVTINSGRLDAGSMDLLVGGDWTNNVGPDAFNERDQKVTFNSGFGHQYCSDETFYTLEVDKTTGAFRVNGSDVVCEEYDWTDGAVDVLSGSFTANDLVDDGIAGSWFVNDEVHLYQDGGHVDLLGELYIYDGGYMHVYGGADDSFWPNGGAGSHIELEDYGVLRFHDVGINILPSGTLTTNLIGGRISMDGDLKVDRPGLVDAGTHWSMEGFTDSEVQIINGDIYQLRINKSGSGIVSAGNYVRPKHLVVAEGSFDVNGKPISLTGDFTVNSNGQLIMNSMADYISCKNFLWDGNSSASVTKGNIYVSGDWTFDNYNSIQLGTDNTVHFNGTGWQFITSPGTDAAFGGISIENMNESVKIGNSSNEVMKVNGTMSIVDGAIFSNNGKELLIEGGLDINNGGQLNVNGSGPFTLNSYLYLDGLIRVSDGEAIINGAFDIEPTGELVINGGSFSAGSGAFSNQDISGRFEMDDGAFNIDGGLRINGGADVLVGGGIIKAVGFKAESANTFQPTGGTVEVDFPGTVKLHESNYFHNLDVNSTSGTNVGASLGSDILVSNDLTIASGKLSINEFTAMVNNDVSIYANLDMDDADSKLIIGNNIRWKPGSSAEDVTNGEIHIYRNFTCDHSVSANMGSNNTVRFIGNQTSIISNFNFNGDLKFGSITIDKSAGVNTTMVSNTQPPTYCQEDLIIKEGNSFHVQSDLDVSGDVSIEDNAEIELMGDVSLLNHDDMSLLGTLEVGNGEVIVDNYFTLKGTLSLVDGSFINNGTGWNVTIDGNINLTGNGLLELMGTKVTIQSNANCNISGGIFRVGRSFTAISPGTFQPTGGTFEITNMNNEDCSINCKNGNYFHNLNINCDVDYTVVEQESDLLVKGNLNILSGYLSMKGFDASVEGSTDIYTGLKMNSTSGVFNAGTDSYDHIIWHSNSNIDYLSFGKINIFGNCTMNDGVSGSIYSEHILAFVGGFEQQFYIYGYNEIGTVLLDKPSGELLIPEGSSVFCDRFDWEQGTLTGNGGSFTCEDLINTSIDQELNMNGGTIHLKQKSGDGATNLGGSINISSGNLVFDGGTGKSSWGLMDNLNLSITDGVLDCKDHKTFIFPGLNMYVTGGIIRTNGDFENHYSDFSPIGGTFEIYSNYYRPDIICFDGHFNDLKLDWGSATFVSNILIKGDLIVEHATLFCESRAISCEGDVEVRYGGDLYLYEGASLKLGDQSTLTIKENSVLSSLGESGNKNLITHLNPGDYYHLVVEDEGTIFPKYTVFEFMGEEGIKIHEQATVYYPYFKNCEFKNGQANSSFLTINNTQDIYIDYATFWSEGDQAYNISKANDSGSVTLTNYYGSFSGEAYENDPNNRIHWEDPILLVGPAMQNVTAPAGATTFEINSNIRWQVSESADWVVVSQMAGTGDKTLTVTYDENIDPESRTAEIVVSYNGNLPDVTVTVTQQAYPITQTITIAEGWSGLSSYVIPTFPSITEVFSDITDELVIALTEDGVYYPEYGVNTIGMWEDFSAYKIKSNTEVFLEIFGSTYPDKTLNIPIGWSLLPVISECPADVETLFEASVSSLEIVKDVAGYGIYWPAMGINTLGILDPGKAYYILTTDAFSVTFDDCSKNSKNILPDPESKIKQKLSGLSPWQLSNPTPSSHSLAISAEALSNIETGNLIGAFDESGSCRGIAVVDGGAAYLNIFGDDPFSSEKDGFEEGELMTIKLFKLQTGEEIILIPGYDREMPNAEGIFVENGLSAITGFKITTAGFTGFPEQLIRVFPNPSSGKFQLSGISPDARVSLTDIQGQVVMTKHEIISGTLEFDLGHCTPGMYFIAVEQQNTISYQKLILK